VAKPKREDKEEGEATAFDFASIRFDEAAFMRREIGAARISFLVAGLGLLAGVLAFLAHRFGGAWLLGLVVLGASVFAIRPILQARNVPEELTNWKSMLGQGFLLFTTGLALWVLLLNLVPA